MHKTLFIKILRMAYLIFPFKKYWTVSSEYAEKVVYPPKNPVIINNLHFGFSEYRSKKLTKKPINNAPTQFTKIVPKENCIFKNELINWVDKYRNKAPIPPPRTTAKYAILPSFIYL